MKKYFILAAAAAVFAACSNSDDELQTNGQEGRMPLSIGTVTGTATMRSASSGLQDDAIKTQIGLYILQQGETTKQTVDYEKFNLRSSTLTADDPASKYTLFNFSSSLYYPDNKEQGIDIYAYAPYSGSAPDDTKNISSDLLTLTTPTIQTYDDDFYAADFLWGAVGAGVGNDAKSKIEGVYTAISKTATVNAIISAKQAKDATTAQKDGYYSSGSTYTDKVVVPMIHLGSKIIIKVVPDGMGADKLKGATVEFKANKSATLNLTTGEVSVPTTADNINMGKLGYSDASTEIPVTDGDANGTKGVMGDGSSTVSGYTCTGVILPQTTTASAELIKITIGTSPNTTDYVYKPSSAITFASSKKYTFEIKVTASGLKVTSTVADWSDDTNSLPDDSGNSEGKGHGKAELQS